MSRWRPRLGRGASAGPRACGIDAPTVPEKVDRAVPGAEWLGRFIGLPLMPALAEEGAVLPLTGSDDLPDLAPPFAQTFVVAVRLPPFPFGGQALRCFRGFIAEDVVERRRIDCLAFLDRADAGQVRDVLLGFIGINAMGSRAARFASKASEMCFRNIRPRATCL